jgi:hypothetical protein
MKPKKNPALTKTPQKIRDKKTQRVVSRLRTKLNLSRQQKNTHFQFQPAWNETNETLWKKSGGERKDRRP